MSDNPLAAILASLERLESGQASLAADSTRLRIDMMGRMDRLQHRMDSLDEHLTLGLGHSDRVEKRAQAVSEDNRVLGEQMMSLTRLLRQLEGRINGLEERRP